MNDEIKRAAIVALYPTLKKIVKGRVNWLWAQTRRQWIELHPPVNGGWECAGCGHLVSARHMTLDHIIMQRDAIELTFTLANLQPMHGVCNVLRGDIMTRPELIVRYRSLPENHYHRIFVDRVLTQAQIVYRDWELNKQPAHA